MADDPNTDPPKNDPPQNDPPKDPPSNPQNNPQSNPQENNDAVKQSIDGLNTTVKSLAEMVGKLPETIGNILKVEDKGAQQQTPGTPGGNPPEEKPKEEAPKEPKQKVGAGNRFSDWFYGKR